MAVIQRVRCYGPNPDAEGNYDVESNLLGQYLLVRGLSGRETRVDIDVSETVNPNAAARAAADVDR